MTKTQRHLSAHSSGHAPYRVTTPMQSETMETQRRLTGGLPQQGRHSLQGNGGHRGQNVEP